MRWAPATKVFFECGSSPLEELRESIYGANECGSRRCGSWLREFKSRIFINSRNQLPQTQNRRLPHVVVSHGRRHCCCHSDDEPKESIWRILWSLLSNTPTAVTTRDAVTANDLTPRK